MTATVVVYVPGFAPMRGVPLWTLVEPMLQSPGMGRAPALFSHRMDTVGIDALLGHDEVLHQVKNPSESVRVGAGPRPILSSRRPYSASRP